MPQHLRSIAVFCGSFSGNDALYRSTAFDAGKRLASLDKQVVYGGARVGLMGAVADGALSVGGSVKGVIPGFLRTKEIAHPGLTELIEVETMHERKLKMHELSDGIIALPGGWGTMEELMEMLTWAQLGLHSKPVGLLNTGGFYDGLIQLIRRMQDQGFLKTEHASMLLIADDIELLLEMMAAYEAPAGPKWISEERT